MFNSRVVVSLILSIASLCYFHSVKADTTEYVRICNTCSSAASYEIAAKEIGPSNTAVINLTIINLERREARAFQVRLHGRPSKPGIEDLIVTPRPLPSDVMPAIEGYHELKAAFEAHRNANGISSLMVFADEIPPSEYDFYYPYHSPFSAANGCGTPSDWSYSVIPDFPFKAACDSHDICYTSARSKTSCDQEFLFNMRQIALSESLGRWWTTRTGQALFALAIHGQAQIYYHAVTQLSVATHAYCAATQNQHAAECAPNAPLQGSVFDGHVSWGYPRYGGGTIHQTCELWRFPLEKVNGVGGYYYMERNCQFYMIP